MNGLLLDTHVWIWYINGNTELNLAAQKIIADALYENNAYLSAISLWEIAMLDKKQRVIFEMPCLEWMNRSISETHIQVSPIIPSVAAESAQLPGNFHDDPADRMIVATARVNGLALMTRDQRIVDYGKQKYVSVKRV